MPQPWFKQPSFIFSTVLTVVLFFAALYGTEIRKGLAWPRKMMTRKMLESYVKFAENELAALDHIHDNAYYLVLWLAWTTLSLLRWIFWALVIGFTGALFFSAITKDPFYRSPVMLLGPAFGAIIGHVQRTYGTITSLYKYHEHTEALKAGIAEAKAMI